MSDTWVTRPITTRDTRAMSLRCWPEDAAARQRLFDSQHTLGMAAWSGSTCVGALHCYAVDLPGRANEDWPAWNQWWPGVTENTGGSEGSAWCHACFHVGRTLARAKVDDNPDETYFGRGIGTALCRASVAWAAENGYACVIAPGAPAALPAYSVWVGGLSWTTYAKLGFREAGVVGPPDVLPEWARGASPPHVMDEARAALDGGREPADFATRLMQFDL